MTVDIAADTPDVRLWTHSCTLLSLPPPQTSPACGCKMDHIKGIQHCLASPLKPQPLPPQVFTQLLGTVWGCLICDYEAVSSRVSARSPSFPDAQGAWRKRHQCLIHPCCRGWVLVRKMAPLDWSRFLAFPKVQILQ